MKNNLGYTLMELIVVIGIIVVIIGAGMGVFYQSLRSGSRIDFELFIEASSRVVENSMVDVIGLGRIVSVSDQDQEVCLAAGAGGVSGDSLVIDIAGKMTEYSLIDTYIASSSTTPVIEMQVSPEGLSVTDLSFNWICFFGEREKIEIDFTAQAEKEDRPVPIEKDYSFELLLRNSGYY